MIRNTEAEMALGWDRTGKGDNKKPERTETFQPWSLSYNLKKRRISFYSLRAHEKITKPIISHESKKLAFPAIADTD